MMNPVALEKLRKYCVYQDRCHKEVRSKLLKLEVYGDELEEVINALIAEDFLNEERFARSFARGKFRIKRWGRIKIKNELKKRHISDYCIRKGMEEIDDVDYEETIQFLIKKHALFSKADNYKNKKKIIESLQRKGFEYEFINKALNNCISNKS